jgi:hypothetical protein
MTTTYKKQFEGLGFSEDAAQALIEAGLDSFVDITALMEDNVSSLMKSLRKPGGGAKGVEISFLSEKCLKTIVFGFCRQLYRTDVYDETDVTKAHILKDFCQLIPQRVPLRSLKLVLSVELSWLEGVA